MEMLDLIPSAPDSGAEFDELSRLSFEYAAAIDAADAERLLQLFEADGGISVFDRGDSMPQRTWQGARLREVVEFVRSFDHTYHLVANRRYRVDGDAAVGEVYCAAHHFRAAADGVSDRLVLIRYRDTYHRRDGWRFVTRHLFRDWSGEFVGH